MKNAVLITPLRYVAEAMMQKILVSALVLAFMLAQVSTADAVNHRRHVALTTTMVLPIATATMTRSLATMSVGLMRCASARSGGGISTTSSVVVVDADCGGHTAGVTIDRKAPPPPTLFAAAAVTPTSTRAS
jgi:hypothetical protein